MKRCPPGVLCIARYSTVLFLLLALFVAGWFMQPRDNRTTVNIHPTTDVPRSSPGYSWIPSWPYTNNDPLLNPYNPPLRDERYFVPGPGVGVVPINVSTNIGAVDTNYRQVGMLTGTATKEKILPLMGRPLFTNRDKWQYYTMSDQRNSIKLPVSRSGRSCTNEYGCTQLYNGDTVFVEGTNEAYRVTLYDNDTIRYLPYL